MKKISAKNVDNCTIVLCGGLQFRKILDFVHLGTPWKGKKSQCSFIVLSAPRHLRERFPVTMLFFSSSICSLLLLLHIADELYSASSI